jgi:hypothetical protein
VAAFEIYCDESGNTNRLVFAGFVASTIDWARFSQDWTDLKKKYEISHFHTKTFRNRQSKLYRHLSRTQRGGLLAAVIRLIRKHVLFGASIGLDLNMFNRLADAEFKGRCGSAYAICALLCAVNVAGDALTARGLRTENMSVFVESGHVNAEDAIRVLKLYKKVSDPVDAGKYERMFGGGGRSKLREAPLKLDTIELASKIAVPGLQAADLLAYCSAASELPDHQFSNLVGRSLAEGIPILGWKLTEDDVSQIIERFRGFFDEESRVSSQRKSGRYGSDRAESQGIGYRASDRVTDARGAEETLTP